MSVFFSRVMGHESQCGTNKSREPRSGSRAICLFRTAIQVKCLVGQIWPDFDIFLDVLCIAYC